jgi:hypothetical protein
MARQEEPAPATTGTGLQGGTLLRGAVAGGVVALAIGAFAWLNADDRPASPLQPYWRLGQEGGAAALRRNLLADVPLGAPPAPLVLRLEGMGFTCRPAEAGWQCRHLAPGEGRRVWRATVELGLAGGVLAQLAVHMTEGAP